MVSQVVCSHVPLRCHQTACQKITRRHRARALTQSPREGGRLHHRSLSPGHRPARWGPAPTPAVRVAQGLCSKDSRLPRGVTRVAAFRAAVCVNSCPASPSLSRPLGSSIRPAVTSPIRAALELEGCDPEGHGQGGSDDRRRFCRTSGAGRPRSRCGWPSTSRVLAGPSLCTSASGPPEGDPVTEDCHPYDRLLPCPQIQPHSKVPGPRTPPCKYWGARFGRKRRLSSPAPPSSHRVCCLPGP